MDSSNDFYSFLKIRMQIKNSNSHKYFLNENINFKIQIYIHFMTKILLFIFE